MANKLYSDVYITLNKVLKVMVINDELRPAERNNYARYLERTEFLDKNLNRNRWTMYVAYLVNHELQEKLSSEIFDYFCTSKNINTWLLKYWIPIDENKFKNSVYLGDVENKIVKYFSDWVLKFDEDHKYASNYQLEADIKLKLKLKGYCKWQN